MSRNLKISLGVVLVALIAVVAIAQVGGSDAETAESLDERTERLVRPDSQRLSTAADGKVTFVEFLDFECEACRAVYPAIEELREQYGDRITFVIRYLPLHRNSEAASRAAEAAADQGQFEAMYHRLFETQPEWGEKNDSQEHVFFGFAEEMDLDMERFRAIYDDPATIERVRQSDADARALGATGTPTFFLNGERLQVSTFAELIERIDDALAA